MKMMIPRVEKILSEKSIFHLHKGKLYCTVIFALSIISFVKIFFIPDVISQAFNISCFMTKLLGLVPIFSAITEFDFCILGQFSFFLMV